MGKIILFKKPVCNMEEKRYESFKEFWPFYLSQHSNRICRRLHIIGTTVAMIMAFIGLVILGNPLFVLYGIALAYAHAWVGHFFFEQNKPATFKYPFWSFYGDLKMWYMTITGKMKF